MRKSLEGTDKGHKKLLKKIFKSLYKKDRNSLSDNKEVRTIIIERRTKMFNE